MLTLRWRINRPLGSKAVVVLQSNGKLDRYIKGVPLLSQALPSLGIEACGRAKRLSGHTDISQEMDALARVKVSLWCLNCPHVCGLMQREKGRNTV